MSRIEAAAQLHSALTAFAANTTNLTDEQALAMPSLFPTWEDILKEGAELAKDSVLRKEGAELAKDSVLRKDGTLYRVVQAVTPQKHQPPDGEGMLAIYRPIEPTHAGTIDDPIPWENGMDCYAGQYYSYNGNVYRVADGGSMIPCVWPPDSGLWQWEVQE